jgi:hypothetical protein
MKEISKSKKLKGTTESQNYIIIYSGVDRNIHGQAVVIIWCHKSINNQILYYKFWNERILEVRIKVNRGKLTLLALYAPEEGREDKSENFYKQLQDIISKANKNNYIILADALMPE